MVLNSIEKLIEKYDNGETSLKEEQKLKDYFAQDNVAPHLESYKIMFQYFKTTKQELYTKDVPLKPKKNFVYQWISVAAVAVLMLGIIIPNMFGDNILTVDDLSPEERKVYFQTQEAMAMLSSNFDKGTSSLSALGTVSDNFNQGASSFNALGLASQSFNVGAEKASYVNKLGKTTNKYLKNTKRKQANN
ncbi:hypothetical protein [Psychroserpens ponticola]|uniref:Uncharacterized protein n=1 Tax=Psychroserpens ponticola TaxID=2932268 RepID=A0ABY7RV92_9FLAO|nr:hypothetical protein [Psychroserpens ponticola]WCO00605.1 hypothetical protein MUN68_011065 [Psychroserpens ponticola]